MLLAVFPLDVISLFSNIAFSFLSVSDMRGFMTSHGQPDQSRSARYVLKDYVSVSSQLQTVVGWGKKNTVVLLVFTF